MRAAALGNGQEAVVAPELAQQPTPTADKAAQGGRGGSRCSSRSGCDPSGRLLGSARGATRAHLAADRPPAEPEGQPILAKCQHQARQPQAALQASPQLVADDRANQRANGPAQRPDV